MFDVEKYKFMKLDYPYADYFTIFKTDNFEIVAVDCFDDNTGIRELYYKDTNISIKICEHTLDKKDFSALKISYDCNDLAFVMLSQKTSIFRDRQNEEIIQIMFDIRKKCFISGNKNDLKHEHKKIDGIQPFIRINSTTLKRENLVKTK